MSGDPDEPGDEAATRPDRREGTDRPDPIDEALMETFPASDPPAFVAGTLPRGPRPGRGSSGKG